MKKYILLLLPLAFILSACGATTTSTNSPSSSPVAKKTLKDLISLGIAQKCTYTSVVGADTTSGEMLINGKKFKQTIKITNAQGTTNMSSVSDGQFIYSWSDKDPNSGFKMKLDVTATSDVTPQAGSSAGKSIDLAQPYDYNCVPATVSDTDFTPPSNVKFTDFSDFTNGLNLDKLKGLIPTSAGE